MTPALATSRYVACFVQASLRCSSSCEQDPSRAQRCGGSEFEVVACSADHDESPSIVRLGDGSAEADSSHATFKVELVGRPRDCQVVPPPSEPQSGHVFGLLAPTGDDQADRPWNFEAAVEG